MKRCGPIQIFPLLVALAAPLLPPAARAQDAAAAEEIAITVGADGTSVVREVRSAQLVAGDSSLRVFDASPQLLPETVALRALTAPELLELRQQSVWFEVLDTARALEQLAGRPATLIRFHESGVEELEGPLLFPPIVPGPHGPVRLPLYVQQTDGRVRMLEGAELELDSLPAGDWNRFRLDWRLTCRRADRYRFELLYVTRGLEWSADYLLRVAADGASGDLTAVATIVNGTGIAWRGAKLAVAEPDDSIGSSLGADPAERTSARFHPVADGATLPARASTQFTLAQARDLKLRMVPTCVVGPAASADGQPVSRRYDVIDAAAHGLSRALPGGTARVVLVDARNRPHVAAVRPLAPTAAGETLSFLGDALPGLVAATERQPLDGHRARDVRVTVRLWNEREEKVDVECLSPLGVAETVADATVTADRLTPRLARFVVSVLPRSSATLQFNLVRP